MFGGSTGPETQYGLIKEYTLIHIINPNIIEAILLN